MTARWNDPPYWPGDRDRIPRTRLAARLRALLHRKGDAR